MPSPAAAHPPTSHHKTAGRSNWGRTRETLEIIEAARRSGLDVTVDMYPYTAGSTIMQALLPPWAQVGGADATVERLGDAAVRSRIQAEWGQPAGRWENLVRAAGWHDIVIASCPGAPDLEGRSVVDAAADAGTSEPDLFLDLLRDQRLDVTIVVHLMAEEDVENVLTYPGSMVGSDGLPLPGRPHPRWAGTFARVLGRYRRERDLLGLEEWVRKITALPAARFGLTGRGVLQPGAVADVAVFDPGSVVDAATFEEPLLPPVGVVHVFVDGVPVVRNSELTGARPGRVLSAG